MPDTVIKQKLIAPKSGSKANNYSKLFSKNASTAYVELFRGRGIL